MTLKFKQDFDGSGRELRDVQKQALQWLSDNWDSHRVFAINAPTGSGKSLIARAIQLATGAPIITASNLLLDQYQAEYGMNFVKGRENYESPDGLSCSTMCPIVVGDKACRGCPYKIARARAMAGEPTVFNPASLYFCSRGNVPGNTRVIDECFPSQTYIATNKGTVTIGDIYKKSQKGEELFVKSFNGVSFEFKKVVAANKKKRINRVVKVYSGVVNFKSTDNHRYLTTRGYVEARYLTTTDRLISTKNGYSRAVPLEDTKQVIIGSILGDGYWRKDKQCTWGKVLSIRHGMKQERYLKFKAGLLDSKPVINGHSGYTGEPQWVTMSGYLDDTGIQDKKDALDEIDARGLSIWFCDDGSLAKRKNKTVVGSRFHTESWSEEDILYAIKVLKERFGIDSHIYHYRTYNIICVSSEGTKKLIEIIKKYVPKCMEYKTNFSEEVGTYDWKCSYADYEVMKVTKVIEGVSCKFVYNIQVEDNNNFVVLSHSLGAAGVVVHNCDLLGDFAKMLCSFSFSRSKYEWNDKCTSEIELEVWLKDLVRRLEKLAKTYLDAKNKKEYRKIAKDLDKIRQTASAFCNAPEQFVIYKEKKRARGRWEEYLNLQPILPPKHFCDAILGKGKVILMSGTLFEPDIKELVGEESYAYLSLPSPIPASRRPIVYQPIASSVTYETPPQQIAESIEKVLRDYPGQNTIIHLSYHDTGALSGYFGDRVLVHTKTTKAATLEQFKKNGGVLLAAGCAVGVNLPDDECRLIYIPRLLKPNLGDPVVKKRKALEGGQEWYDFQVLKTAIQAAGRAARHEKDFAVTIIGDPAFARLVMQYYKKLPQCVLDAIKWA